MKLVLVFPSVSDTSDAWFEPRRRRIAGPASDLCLGGAFTLGCLALRPGAMRDVLFRLSFGAYALWVVMLVPLAALVGPPLWRRPRG